MSMSLVEYKGMRFLIHDMPVESNIKNYLQEYKKYNVTHLVRVCACGYPTEVFEKNNVKMVDLPFNDGTPPPSSVIANWLNLIDSVFPVDKKSEECIAIQYVLIRFHF